MMYKCSHDGCHRSFETKRGKSTHESNGHGKKYTNEEWLRQKYHDEELFIYEIAEECDVKSQTVRKWMMKLGVERRNSSEAKILEWAKAGSERSEEYAERMAEVGSSHSVSFWDVYDDETAAEVRQRLSEAKRGEKNPLWKGGHEEYYGSSWTEELRESVRDRDGRECKLCGKDGNGLDVRLHVHHVIPFREFGVEKHKEANRMDNLISLCPSCHGEVEHGKKEQAYIVGEFR